MLKEERKALRDELERVYGIHLREDDELLPIIQFITEASKLADLNVAELKRLLEEMKSSSEAAFGQYANDYKQFHKASRELYAAALNESRAILVKTRQDLEGLPGIFLGFRQSIERLKIPTQITVKRISFEENTCSTRETAKLLRIIGESLQMRYNVDQSGSSGIGIDDLQLITKSFEYFKYSSRPEDFDLNIVINEIDLGRPVMLIGCSGYFCHAWIATAYGVDQLNDYYLFMNWGTGFNSWSRASEWSAAGITFAEKRKMIYNIRPN